MNFDYIIIGAGISGIVFAERLASKFNKKVIIIEKRNHIGGNAYDEYDDFGILVHRYGPHIFHTNSMEVFDYLSKFTEWRKYEHRVLARSEGENYPIPINRITINKIYNLDLSSETEVKNFFQDRREVRNPILNSEDIIVNQIGIDLYEKFFKFYTKKQWNLDPSKLSPSVCGRIPVRTNDEDRYFTDQYQFMPKDGYTKMFERMLAGKNIEVKLNTDYKDFIEKIKYKKMIYTGPIDYFFDYKYGNLPYRSIRFEWENYKKERYQEAAVVNHVDENVDFTRVTEYKYITGQNNLSTTISKEFAQSNGEPYYPVPNRQNEELYMKYKKEANKLENVIFCGRLAEFKYYNMDQIVAKIIKATSE